MGVLGWAPSEFWAATPYDLVAATEGWKEAHGLKDESGLSVADVLRLREQLDEALRGENG